MSELKARQTYKRYVKNVEKYASLINTKVEWEARLIYEKIEWEESLI
jgi:hypothetical protein